MTLVDNHKPNITIVTPKGNVIIDLLTAEVEISEGVLVSEAAKVFWEAIKLEGKSLAESKAEAERLREELAETREFAEAMLKERDIAFASNCKNRCARLEYLENKLDVASNEQLDNFLKKAYLISKLQHIQDYWNKDENEKAMSNALWHILDVVDDLLAGLEG